MYRASVYVIWQNEAKIRDPSRRRLDDIVWSCSLDAPRMAIPNVVVTERPTVNYLILAPLSGSHVTAQIDTVPVTLIGI
jgi:hypothetical protein